MRLHEKKQTRFYFGLRKLADRSNTTNRKFFVWMRKFADDELFEEGKWNEMTKDMTK